MSLALYLTQNPLCLTDPNTPIPVLKQLAKDKDADVRGRVAEHPNTPIPVLVGLWESDQEQSSAEAEQLAKDKDVEVRGSEPHVPTVTVERHQTDDPDVTRYVAIDGTGIAAAIRVHVVRK